jgi:hypothetical protein
MSACADSDSQPAGRQAANRYSVGWATVGTTWKYETDGTGGSNFYTLSLTSISPTADGTRFTFLRSGTGVRRVLTYVVRRDGSEELPIVASLQVPAGVQLTRKSGALVLPPARVLDTGTPRRSRVVIRESRNGRSADVTIDAIVQGHNTETITVPAGTFRARVVTISTVERVGEQILRSVAKYWLAARVGSVKIVQRTVGESSSTTTTERLAALTPGR